MARTLVIALARFGDLLQSFTAISDLHQQSAGEEVALLVPDDLASVAKLHTKAGQIIPFPGNELVDIVRDGKQVDILDGLTSLKPVFEAIESFNPDLIVNLTHTRFSGMLTDAFSGAAIRGRQIQRSGDEILEPFWTRYFFSLLESRECNGFNLVDLHRKIASDVYGSYDDIVIAEEDRQYSDQLIPDTSAELKVAIGTGANHPLRRWSLSSWKEVIGRLICDHSMQIVLTGTKDESSDADKLCEELGSRVISLCGQTNPGQLAAVIDKCDLFIGLDSGPLHLAALLNKPCIGLYFAMASAWETAPYTDRALTLEADLDCHPCSENSTCTNPVCHNVITVSSVLNAVEHLLEKIPLRDFSEVRVKRTAFDLSGLLTLSGQKKSGDAIRLFWRLIFEHMYCGSFDSSVLEQIDPNIAGEAWQKINQLEKKLIGIVQNSISQLQSQLDQGIYQDTLSGKIIDLSNDFQFFRPLFNLFSIECLNHTGESISPIERVLMAQENLLQRVTQFKALIQDSQLLNHEQAELKSQASSLTT